MRPRSTARSGRVTRRTLLSNSLPLTIPTPNTPHSSDNSSTLNLLCGTPEARSAQTSSWVRASTSSASNSLSCSSISLPPIVLVDNNFQCRKQPRPVLRVRLDALGKVASFGDDQCAAELEQPTKVVLQARLRTCCEDDLLADLFVLGRDLRRICRLLPIRLGLRLPGEP